MQHVTSTSGITVSFDRYGSGPPLVLVHGSFMTHETNWQLVQPMLAEQFTVHAIARRGRGETDATRSHGVMDEAHDVGTVLKELDEPAYLLGHSFGAHVALAAAMEYEQHIAKLILYEPPSTDLPKPEELKRLQKLVGEEQWDEFATRFCSHTILMPPDELLKFRNSDLWSSIVTDAPASLGDIQALKAYDFDIERTGKLKIPVLLQYGGASPPDLYLTEPLNAVLPDARVDELTGQGHDGMFTAPDQYAASVTRFLLSKVS